MTDEDQEMKKAVNERTRAALIIGAAIGLAFLILALSAWIASLFPEPVRMVLLVIGGLLSLVCVVAPISVVLKNVHANKQSPGLPPPCNDDVPAIRAALVVVGTIVVVFGLLAGGAWVIKAADDAVRLPLLVIAGLVSLIALLAVMAIAFKTV